MASSSVSVAGADGMVTAHEPLFSRRLVLPAAFLIQSKLLIAFGRLLICCESFHFWLSLT
jgi:hypothetical protein